MDLKKRDSTLRPEDTTAEDNTNKESSQKKGTEVISQ